jgi:aminoglycoside phosphotransferase
MVRETSDIRLRERDGELQLKGAYVSFQGGEPFAARTLLCGVKARDMRWQAWPDDPALPGLARILARAPRSGVLRYVPGRRATLRVPAAGVPVVVKVKKPDRIDAAIRAHRAVAEALGEGGPGIGIPRLLDHSAEDRSYTQSLCPGVTLAQAADRGEARALLRRAGRLHARLHALDSSALPDADDAARWADLRERVRLVALACPEHEAALRDATATLDELHPLRESPVLCHGDPACDQLLVDGDRWTLVDVELAHRGSRHRDLAMFLASIGPARGSEALRDAYAAGYRDEAGTPLDPALLAWHAACAELHRIAHELAKGRWSADGFARRVGRVAAACERLRAAA